MAHHDEHADGPVSGPGPGAARASLQAGGTVALVWTEALFGVACLACGAPGTADGLGCDQHQLRLERVARCRHCAAALPPALAADSTCGACRRERHGSAAPRIERAHCVGDYDEPLLRELVLAFKHGGRAGLAPHLGALLHAAATAPVHVGDSRADDDGRLRRGDVLVPVPLHLARRIERGYDQARLLSEGVAAAAVPGFHASRAVLRRVRATAPQGATGLLSREDNVHGAFAPARPASWSSRLVRGRRVWLVDDVWTSGSTLRACAAVLREMGVAWCGALVVARASGAHRRVAPLGDPPDHAAPPQATPTRASLAGGSVAESHGRRAHEPRESSPRAGGGGAPSIE